MRKRRQRGIRWLSVLLLAICVGCSAGDPNGSVTHDSPELEALLPEMVNGETLEPGSIVGHTFIERVAGIAGLDAEAYESDYLDAGLELEQLRMAQASPNGGLDAVWVTSWPNNDVGPYAYELLVWAAGIDDERYFTHPYPLQDRTIAGKDIAVGTPEMMVHQLESRPQRRPYGYVVDGYFFLIVTDSDEWAEQVLQQLP